MCPLYRMCPVYAKLRYASVNRSLLLPNKSISRPLLTRADLRFASKAACWLSTLGFAFFTRRTSRRHDRSLLPL